MAVVILGGKIVMRVKYSKHMYVENRSFLQHTLVSYPLPKNKLHSLLILYALENYY